MAARKREAERREPKATRVFQRLYFDSNVLIRARWPTGSAELETLATLGRDVGVELFLPEPVAQELDAHWLREFRRARSRASSGVGEFDKLVAQVSSQRPALTLPNEGAVRADYGQAVQAIQRRLDLKRSPATARPTAVFFDLAVRRAPPFGDEGRGFQDAVILFSVIDHLRAADAAGVVAGLVTGDKMLGDPEARRLVQAEGVVIEVFEDMEPVIGRLTGRLAVTQKELWERDCRAAATALRAAMPRIQEFISANLDVSQRELALVNPLVAFPAVEILNLGNVRTPFPPERTEGDSVAITFDAEVVLSIVIEMPVFDWLDLARWRQPPRIKVGWIAPEPRAEPRVPFNLRSTGPDLLEQRAPRIVEVEASATFRGGQYTDVTPRAVRIKPAPGLSEALRNPYLP